MAREEPTAEQRNAPRTVYRDGIDWPLGTASHVAWIETEAGLEITSGIPPLFAAYGTLVLPDSDEEQASHDAAVIELLGGQSGDQPWWLGFLETSQETDVAFPEAPRVRMYADWPYVVVQAGADQALHWREPEHKGALPDVIFPADRSWLFSTLWDDDWTCLGGPRRLVDDFLRHPELAARAREVQLGEDATPPGHTAI